MPTYDYQCVGCGKEWEAFLSVGDRELPCEQPCPQCKKKKVQRAWITPPVGVWTLHGDQARTLKN